MAAMPDWQQLFVDERLRQVIALALNNNRDLRVAMLNIEKARAEYRIQRASLFPAVTATGSHTAQRSSTVGGMAGMSGSTGGTTGAQAGGTGAASGGLSDDSRTSRTASLDVGITSWELDLFGRVRSLRDQALESWLAMNETQRSTRLSLVAEVATDWLTVAAYQQRLELAQETLASIFGDHQHLLKMLPGAPRLPASQPAQRGVFNQRNGYPGPCPQKLPSMSVTPISLWLTNSFRPRSINSRPKPERRMPPNGRSAFTAVGWLM